MTKIFDYRKLCAGLLFSALCGCGTTPSSQLYVLESTTSDHTQQAIPSVSVVVDEVVLREYLTRKELLRHDRKYQISVSEYQRWAEPLRTNMTVVLAENLSRLLRSDNVVIYPSSLVRPVNYKVAVEVYSFGPDPGGEVVLNSRWAIIDSGGVTVATARSQTSESARSYDPVDTVEAMSLALGEKHLKT